MRRLSDLLAAWAVTLWVGGLFAIGYLAAPVLFHQLEDRALAGVLAGRMFSLIAYVGMACGGYLLLYRLFRYGAGSLKQAFFWLVLVMLLLTLGQRYGIQPIMEGLKAQALPQDVMHSLFRDRFQTWHGISSAVYLVQSLLGLVLVAKTGSR
jgi:drug/metabolite transporter (DMT)-like permease